MKVEHLADKWHDDWEDLRIIVKHYNAGNDAFFEDNGIEWSQKGKHAIFNYRQDAISNRYNVWCRALVLAENGSVLSLPFIRFLNNNQKDAPKLNPIECELIEKKDGCLIGGFWDGDEFVFHTRRTISAHKPDMDLKIVNFHNKSYSLLQVAKKYVDQIKWSKYFLERKHLCFAFELIHDATKILTEYSNEDWGLYLLNVRNINTMRDQEFPSEVLDEFAREMGVRRPQVWQIESCDQIEHMMAKESKTFEGYVLRNRETGQRVKYKNRSYVEKHHMLNYRTYKRIIPVWLKGERDEIEAYFPSTKSIFEELENALEVVTQQVKIAVEYWKHQYNAKKWTRKQLAEQVLNNESYLNRSHVFKLYDKEWDKDCVRKSFSSKSISDILDILKLESQITAEDI